MQRAAPTDRMTVHFQTLKLLVVAALVLSPVGSAASPQRLKPVEIVDRLLADFVAENLSGIESYTASGATMVTQLPLEAPIRLTGKTEIAAYFRTVFDRYDSITVSDIIKTPATDGRTIVVEAKGTYRTVQGDAHTVGYVWIVRTSRGMIVSSRNYTLPLPAGVQP